MVYKVVVILIAAFTFVSTSIIPVVKVLQGPGSKIIIYGPDGSVLKTTVPGGTVVTDPHAPVGFVLAGPAILPTSPEVIVDGGSVGKIVASYTLAGPAVVSYDNSGDGTDDGSYKEETTSSATETKYDYGSYKEGSEDGSYKEENADGLNTEKYDDGLYKEKGDDGSYKPEGEDGSYKEEKD